MHPNFLGCGHTPLPGRQDGDPHLARIATRMRRHPPTRLGLQRDSDDAAARPPTCTKGAPGRARYPSPSSCPAGSSESAQPGPESDAVHAGRARSSPAARHSSRAARRPARLGSCTGRPARLGVHTRSQTAASSESQPGRASSDRSGPARPGQASSLNSESPLCALDDSDGPRQAEAAAPSAQAFLTEGDASSTGPFCPPYPKTVTRP